MSAAARVLGRYRASAGGVLLVLFVLLTGANGAPAAEVIQAFDSQVQVAKDGMLTVTETIRVHAEGRAIRRGIYRDFPLAFRDAGGHLREVTFDLDGVSRDGKDEPYHTQRIRGGVRIYAGDKDVLIPPGEHTYVFRYRTGRQVRWFDGKPELNWNVTGNFWNFPILTARYRLELPGSAAPVRWTAFTGRRGERGTDWRGSVGSGGVLTVSTARPLAAGEGLTVVAEIPAGAVEPPGRATQLWYAFLDNRGWIFGGIGFVLVFAYYVVAWNAVGRDPKRSIVIPLFHPPTGVSPALANYIRNWGLNREKWRAFTAAALSLAVRGLIKFEDDEGTLTLKRTGKNLESDSKTLPAGEGAILSWLDTQDGNATIDRAHGSAVAELGDDFTTAIETENRNRFFRRNVGFVVAGLAMTAAVVIGIIVFGGLSDPEFGLLIVLCFGGFFIGMLILPISLALFGGARSASVVRFVMTIFVLGIFASIVMSIVHSAFPNGFGDALPMLGSLISDYPFPFVLLTSFAALNGLFLYLMRAPTSLGRPIMDRLDGFRLYLETAEKDRLNMKAPEITADRFEALLPYAVALDVEKPWSDAFAAALRRAHPGEADPMSHYHPVWTGGSGWSGADFGSAVAATVNSTRDAFSSAVPVSSGSSGFSGGGGGGSGGGGGGGGGGGW
jgi:uncharacterized membrane protein YgcG